MQPYVVPDDPPLRREENLGSKGKFWFEREGEDWLFKAARPGTGEDWAEVVAARCARALGLPHAHYELALWREQRGVVSRKLHGAAWALVLGNELLAEQDPTYPSSPPSGRQYRRTQQHTLDAVFRVLGRDDIGLPEGWPAPQGVRSAADVFAGYLLLDAWVANTDRHHLNWGVLETGGDHRRLLAPTFDHAACLGANLTDDERRARLCSRDPGYAVAAYVRRARARSALFRDSGDDYPLALLDAFREWALRAPGTGRRWVTTLSAIEDAALESLACLPVPRMSEPARRFALEMLRLNKQRILEGDRS